MERLGKRIAFLATGDEIVNGDILDTNAPHLARQLIDHSFIPGTRLIVSDDQTEMENAIRYLLKGHEALITIGGLGPTSDDRTRFAVSETLEQTLEFDQGSWDRIVEKLSAYKLDIPENNRQQCLFPKNAEIYPNPNGTASGCCIPQGDKLVFMIPGPPNECRPLFTQYILPRLLKTSWQQQIYRRSWMLLGVSEGKIAAGLDVLVSGTECDIGYRVAHPYLEVKLQSAHQAAFESMSIKIEEQIRDRLICRGKLTASNLFLQYIQEYNKTISILDEATQGRLASTLLWPKTYNKLFFNGKKADIEVHLQNLSAYWQKNEGIEAAELPITVKKDGKTISDHIIKVPLRGNRTPQYAVELVCEYLLKTLR